MEEGGRMRKHQAEIGKSSNAKAGADMMLTESQLKAVYAPTDRPLLIVASAGSGKTFVLCHRILYLISKGISPKDILAVTFTRRAGQDLLHRLKAAASSHPHLSETATNITGIRVGTFHSFCLSVLRAFPTCLGLSPNFIVFTPRMQLDLLECLVEEWYTLKRIQTSSPVVSFQPKHPRNTNLHKEKPQLIAFIKATAYRLLQHIRKLQTGKSHVDIKDVELSSSLGDDFLSWVIPKYRERMVEANGIDFDSFVRSTIKIVQKHPTALEIAGLKARYIFVDEFQDTDIDQFELLRTVCGGHAHITVVGDDDQQIYSWRGANGFYNMTLFEKNFSGAEIVKLEQNFRSSGAIVAATRTLISKNRNRVPKTIRTASPTGALMSICECRNDYCEATAIVNFIQWLEKQGVPFHEIAILYRLQRVGLEIQHHLQSWGIECYVIGSGLGSCGNLFSVKKYNGINIEIGSALHDILAVLSLAICDSDEIATLRLLKSFCQDMSFAIKECLSYIKIRKNCSLLHAVKVVRSHFVGSLVCNDLASYAPAESVSLKSKSDCLSLEGMTSMLKLISATKHDSKHMGLRDVVFNVLQQISFTKGSKEFVQGLNSDIHKRIPTNAQCASTHKVNNSPHGIYVYAGVKALLKEASLYDSKIESASKHRNYYVDRENENVNPQASYMDLKARRKRKTKESFKGGDFASKHDTSTEQDSVDKLKRFLDHIALKMHDNEIGEDDQSASINSSSHDGENLISQSGIALSTIHQAKGLEWSAVILARANEGIIPVSDSDFMGSSNMSGTYKIVDSGIVQEEGLSHSKDPYPHNFQKQNTFLLNSVVEDNNTRGGIEEERRLMYVALTRARKFVLVTHIINDDGQTVAPSRFLDDIPPGLVCKKFCYESKSADPALWLSSSASTPEKTPKSCVSTREMKKASPDAADNRNDCFNTEESKTVDLNFKSEIPLKIGSSKHAVHKAESGNVAESDGYTNDSDFEVSGRKKRRKRQNIVVSSEEED